MKPKFKHPLNTKAGRIERAIWTLLDGERRGLNVARVVTYIQNKGCSADEIAEALNQASNGAVLK